VTDFKTRFPVYSKLLKLYPVSYRQRFEDQILQTTADMIDDTDSFSARLRIWLTLGFELPFNVARAQFQSVDGQLLGQAPKYLKINSLIASALLLPFFAALIANSLNKLINNHSLLNSWLWQRTTALIWVIRLPEIAFLIAACSYFLYVFRPTSADKASSLRRALNLKGAWPVIIPAGLAFGILFMFAFHDVTACVIQNPVHLMTHLSQAWHCVVPNSAFKRRLFL